MRESRAFVYGFTIDLSASEVIDGAVACTYMGEDMVVYMFNHVHWPGNRCLVQVEQMEAPEGSEDVLKAFCRRFHIKEKKPAWIYVPRLQYRWGNL